MNDSLTEFAYYAEVNYNIAVFSTGYGYSRYLVS
jgi:hypothetical protein